MSITCLVLIWCGTFYDAILVLCPLVILYNLTLDCASKSNKFYLAWFQQDILDDKHVYNIVVCS